MKNQPRQFAIGVTDEGVEQRVAARPVEPAQRRIGRHTINADLQPGLLQRSGLGARLGLTKVAPVADATRHRKTPGLELERQLGRGHQVPDHRAALQVGITLVAGVVR